MGEKTHFVLAIVLFCSAVPSSRGSAQTEIKVALTDLSASAMPFLIAEKKGFYENERLKVETIVMQGGIHAQALLGESVHFTTAPNVLDVVVSGKVPSKIVYAMAKFLLHRFIVGPKINDFSELRGKRFAISSFGGLSDRMAREIFEEHGLIPMKDVIFLAIGTPSVRYAALKADSVQGALLSSAYALRGLKEGLKDLPYRPIPNVSYPITLLNKTLDKQREMVLRFLRGTVKGHIFFGKRRDEAIGLMIKYLRIPDPKLAAEYYDDEMRRYNPGGMMDENEMKRVIERARATEKVKNTVKITDVFELRLASKIYSELKNEGWEPYE